MPRKAAEKTKKGVESNVKALKFQDFLVDNDIKAFSTESIDDDFQTVMFRSRLEAKGQILPLAVIIDTTPFIMIRTQMTSGLSESKHARIGEYLNKLNARYKIFKYYLREDGSIYLDICLPAADENFSGKTVQTLLSVLVRHAEEVYEDFMEHIWAKK